MMRVRPLPFAALVSALFCAATITLWVLTATSNRRIILLSKNPAIYAWQEGIGLRVVTSQGARSWDIGYFAVTATTFLIPGIWLWRRLPRGKSPVETANPEARALQRQIASLFPGAIAFYLMIGITALAVDKREPSMWLLAATTDVALIANLVSRHRLNPRLKRLLSGQCPACGHNLAGNVTGTCPECGIGVSSSS